MGMITALRERIGDPVLFATALALSVFGVAMIYSAGQFDIPDPVLANVWRQQLVWLGISVLLFLALVRIPVQWYEWITLPAYTVGILLLMATLLIGVGRGTAQSTRSWIDLGPVAVQPAQFANVATILMLSRVMGGWREPPRSLWALWLPALIVALPLGLIMLQPDLGTAMILGAVLIATLYWGGTPLGLLFLLVSPLLGLFLSIELWLFSIYMLGLIAFLYFYRVYLSEAVAVLGANLLAGTVALPIWNSLEVYQRNRFIVFLDPTLDPQGAGYQLIQSRVAIGSGGVFGKGYMMGTQKALKFLPEQHTDFIFAVVGEELGFIGAVAVVAAFAFMLWRLVRLAERTADPFAGILVFGIFGAWFAHILVNVGMTVGLMPITGIPLPFLSYGGSFLVANFTALAMAERIAAETARS